MSLHADAIKAVAELAVKANGNRIVSVPGDPPHVFRFIDKDGDITVHITAPFPLKTKHNSIASIAEFVAKESVFYKADVDDEDATINSAAVWYSRKAIVAVVDHFDAIDGPPERRNTGTLTLTPSPQMARLQQLAERRPISQRDLILMLRTEFTDSLSRAGDLINILRNIRFDIGQAGDSEVKHGKTSIGKSMRAEITGAGSIPEMLVLDVPPFASNILARSQWSAVRMALEPDPATATFQFFPLAGEIDMAWASAEMALHDSLAAALEAAGATPRVYHGEPN